MDFRDLISQLEAGDTDKALETAKALQPKFDKTVSDLNGYETKFVDAVSTRDKAKAKLNSLVDALGLTVEDATPEAVEALIKKGKTDETLKAEIDDLKKLLKANEDNHKLALADKDKAFTEKLLEVDISKVGLTANVVNEKALSMVVEALKSGATLEDGAIVYKDQNGVIVKDATGQPITVGQRLEQFKADESNAFLFKATTNGGGGSQNGGTTTAKKWADLSTAEKVDLHKSNPSEYERLRDEHNKL